MSKFPFEFRLDRCFFFSFSVKFIPFFYFLSFLIPHSSFLAISLVPQLFKGELLDVEYTRQVLCVDASQCEKKNSACQGPGVSVRTQQLVFASLSLSFLLSTIIDNKRNHLIKLFALSLSLLFCRLLGLCSKCRCTTHPVQHAVRVGNRIVKHAPME